MTRILFLALLSFAVSLHAQDEAQAEYSMRATGDLEIGPDGRVRSWKLDGEKLGDTVETLVQRNVENWRFEPILDDGQPVIAKTRMSVELQAVPQGEGLLLKVDNVHFGALETSGKMKPPRYPAGALREQLGARVLLMVRVDAAGNVVQVHPYQTSLSKRGRERQEASWRAQFERVSVAAVSEWKYEPDEMIGGVPVSQVIFVPIHFQVTERGENTEGRWDRFFPGPVTPAPWAEAERVAQVDASQLDEGETAGLGSAFELLGDVVGTTL